MRFAHRGVSRPVPKIDQFVSVGSIVVRCFEYERMVDFWREALRYEEEHEDPNGGFVILRDPRSVRPNIR